MGKLQHTMNLALFNPTCTDLILYSRFLQLCIDRKAEKQGRFMHGHLITNGFIPNLYLNTKLIILYMKIGDMLSARNVFDKMPNRSIVSWTAMLSGYSQNGHHEKALKMFAAMHRVDIKANQFTYGSALRACTKMGCLEGGMQIQGCIHKGRFFGNLFVQSALVDLHSKCGKIADACKLFKMMSERDVVSWNAMIGGYAVQGFSDESFRIFRLMLREGMVPDCFTLGSILRGSSGGSSLIKVNQVHGIIAQLGFESHNMVSASLIHAYAECGSVRSAKCVYDSMSKKDLISCTALITGYAREGRHGRDALNLFNEMIHMHMEMDEVILCSMLNVCADIASLSLGRQIHALAVKHQSDVAMTNALIDMYAKSGDIEDANRAFDEMEEKNVLSWTSLISGYAKHGYGDKAIALYQMMEGKGLKPNDVTFLSILFACSHTGLAAEGWDCFNDMVNKYHIVPRAEHYSCMVDLYARGGQLKEAYDFISSMKVKPNASLWGSILGACSIYNDRSLGEVTAKHLFHLNPENPVNYIVLSSIYSAAGMWDDALNTRILLEERKLKKTLGYSFFQSSKKSNLLLC